MYLPKSAKKTPVFFVFHLPLILLLALLAVVSSFMSYTDSSAENNSNDASLIGSVLGNEESNDNSNASYRGIKDVNSNAAKVYMESVNKTDSKIPESRIVTEDGKELELRTKEGTSELLSVEVDSGNKEIKVRTNGNDSENSKLHISVDGTNFKLVRDGVTAESSFPLTIDDESGQVLVQTPIGDIDLKTMPDTIVSKAVSIDGMSEVVSVSIDDEKLETSNLQYVLTGFKSENFLGMFRVKFPTSLVYDVQTGELVSSEQTFTTKAIDLLSF